MNKKKLFVILGIVIFIVVLVILIIFLTGKNSNVLKYSDDNAYKVKIELPENIDNNDYKIIKNDDEKTELNNNTADFAVTSDKVSIEFEKRNYTFNQTLEYIDKYGQEDSNFDNFCKYILDAEINGDIYTNAEIIEVNGNKAIQYMYKDILIRVLNTDEISKAMYISIKIYSKNSEDNILDLIQEEEVKQVIDAITFNKK